MKNIIALLLTFSLIGCSAPQEPVFMGFRNIRTINATTQMITVTANAVFHNPNALNGEVVATDVQVIVNDVPAGVVAQDLAIPVPAGEEFLVPLTFQVSPRDIYENDRNGALGGIINAVLTKKVDVRYEGTVRMKIAGFPYTLEVDHEEEVTF